MISWGKEVPHCIPSTGVQSQVCCGNSYTCNPTAFRHGDRRVFGACWLPAFLKVQRRTLSQGTKKLSGRATHLTTSSGFLVHIETYNCTHWYTHNTHVTDTHMHSFYLDWKYTMTNLNCEKIIPRHNSLCIHTY